MVRKNKRQRQLSFPLTTIKVNVGRHQRIRLVKPCTVIEIIPTVNLSHTSISSISNLQGSVATPCYTVLHDELNLSMDALETMTFGLTHLHQICSMTTSLPTPLEVAIEYATRGVGLLQEKV